jgi:hypothetical protein
MEWWNHERTACAFSWWLLGNGYVNISCSKGELLNICFPKRSLWHRKKRSDRFHKLLLKIQLHLLLLLRRPVSIAVTSFSASSVRTLAEVRSHVQNYFTIQFTVLAPTGVSPAPRMAEKGLSRILKFQGLFAGWGLSRKLYVALPSLNLVRTQCNVESNGKCKKEVKFPFCIIN